MTLILLILAVSILLCAYLLNLCYLRAFDFLSFWFIQVREINPF